MASQSDLLKVLLVDDDINICKTVSLSLRGFQCVVTQAQSVASAIELLRRESFEMILTDFRLGNQTGSDLIREAKVLQPSILIAVMTAFASIDNAVEVTKEGAFDYIPKPFTQAQLEHLLKKVKLVVSLRKENEALKRSSEKRELFRGMTSVASQRLEEFVKKVAPTEATLLLTGESGTGKSELARYIHKHSQRANKPFVIVNCTSLAESLLESEIFGHVKGSFTGATQDKMGKFELANHGTLFLDEIGELSLGAQSKLLRFLQDKVIERVGSNQTVNVDARVIAATNRNLEELVANGQFREDLYYRINIFESNLVPLRYRREDLEVFIQSFLQEVSSAAKLSGSPTLSEPIRELLSKYDWPGNLRELRNVIERLVLLSTGRKVEIADLPEKVIHFGKNPRFQDERLVTLEEASRLHIEKVLTLEPNLDKASEILGITKVTLWRRRKEYGLA